MKYLVALIVLIATYALGRYMTPAKVVVKTEIQYVEKKTDQSEAERNKHKETTIVVVTHKDGTTETTTKVVEDSQTDKKTASTDDINSQTKTYKEVTRGSLVTVSALAGVNTSNWLAGPDYGVSVYKPILGPIGIGAFAFKSGIVGMSAGLSF